ncbi:MAG: rRNA pseudouridine synthase [Lachnospiraceae bacterium]|nr:rRNA pseudouridine synthase [Lachnospiraceae bacterium]
MESCRINKYLAECGVCSRREADSLVQTGRVTVNGAAAVPGMKVTGEETICVDGAPVAGRQEKVLYAFYKPVGVTCSEKDAHAEHLVTEYFADLPQRLTYAGRLDKDSEGLLLMTDDGDLIQSMMKGAMRHEKEYVVTIREELTPELIGKLEHGVYLPDLGVKTRPCRVKRRGEREFSMILTQGLNRQIRRMCKACGAHVVSLKRIRVMNVELGDLQPGERRRVEGEELETLYRSVGR